MPSGNNSFVEEHTVVTYAPMPVTQDEVATFHTDSNYQYRFRTGESGSYKYNYNVVGIDDGGNPIKGNVSMQGKNGAGIIILNENEIKVTLEWVGYGKLKAHDEHGSTWDMKVE